MTKEQKKLLSRIESEGIEVDSYPCDESQTVANAGDCTVYELDGTRYCVTVWNELALDHKEGETEIEEMTEEEDE